VPDYALRQTLLNVSSGIPNSYLKYFLFMMATILILAFILLCVCENLYARSHCKRLTKLCRSSRKKMNNKIDGVANSPNTLCRDEDVVKERILVDRIVKGNNEVEDDNNYAVIVDKLEKKYFDYWAVLDLNFAVRQGECFGLLGKKGAGKTTALKMMTRCKTLTNGSVKVNNVSCHNDELQYKSQFGYCPEVDALDPFMTAYEILEYFGRVRGIPRDNLSNAIDDWLKRLDIVKFRNHQVQYLSVGSKRKLSMAVAMVGNPPVLFLDEPTMGVDLKDKYLIWKCIKEFQQQNRTIILTSRSMDECEQLCDRIAHMEDGQITFIGGIRQVRNKYGKRFKLTVKLKMSNNENLTELNELKLAIGRQIVDSLEYQNEVSISS
jgi:ABC-type multidrug transport system ATPase subunit